MKFKSILIALFFSFGIAKTQVVLEKEYSINNENALSLEEVNTDVFKYVINDTTNKKLILNNLDHSLWREINIPQITGYEINDLSYVTQVLFNPDEKIEFLCSYYRASPYDVIHVVFNESGNEIFKVSQHSISIFNVGENLFKMGVYSWYAPYKHLIYSLPGIYPKMISSKSHQQLSLSNDTLYLTNGGQVYLGKIGTTNVKNAIVLDNAAGIGFAYPNPSTSVVNIEYILPEKETSGKIVILNMNGIEVYNVHVFNSSKHVQADLSGFPAGSYQVQLITENGFVSSKKVIMIN